MYSELSGCWNKLDIHRKERQVFRYCTLENRTPAALSRSRFAHVTYFSPGVVRRQSGSRVLSNKVGCRFCFPLLILPSLDVRSVGR